MSRARSRGAQYCVVPPPPDQARRNMHYAGLALKVQRHAVIIGVLSSNASATGDRGQMAKQHSPETPSWYWSTVVKAASAKSWLQRRSANGQ
jgi:hypothetical protein